MTKPMTKSKTTTIQFSNVGRNKRSWTATLSKVSWATMYREVKAKGALMSEGVAFEWDSDTEGRIIVGGFRTVGTFAIVATITEHKSDVGP